MSVGYDFGVLSQKRLAWTKGKKLQYEFVVTVTAIPDGGALEALVAVVDGALALDAKLIVQRISASLSLEASQRVRSKLLEEAVANARANASIIAETSGLRLVGVSAVSMVGALPATSFGDNLDQDGLNILGRSYASILVLRKPFSIDAGIPDVELTGSVVATFCAEAM
jgi:hypothetical protein